VSKIRPSRKASSFTESVIREMTRLSIQHGAINLSQGFPDFPAPEEIKEAARAGDRGRHQPIPDHVGRRAVPRRDR
jgi:aspartate/methionine/tyrosine aminotransferase